VFTATLQLRSVPANGEIEILVNGLSQGKYEITTNGNTWAELNVSKIKLQKGLNTVRIKAVKGGYEFKQIELK